MKELKCDHIATLTGGVGFANWEESDRVYSVFGICPAVTAKYKADPGTGFKIAVPKKRGGLLIKNATKQGYLIAEDGDGIDISTRMDTHRGTVQKGLSLTIKTQIDVGVCIKK